MPETFPSLVLNSISQFHRVKAGQKPSGPYKGAAVALKDCDTVSWLAPHLLCAQEGLDQRLAQCLLLSRQGLPQSCQNPPPICPCRAVPVAWCQVIPPIAHAVPLKKNYSPMAVFGQ